MTLKKNIAIIGSGISGLSCAYILDKHANVTLFESNDYFGGHTNTVTIARPDQEYAIDTGFIVFNKKNYPLFTKLLETIQAPYQHSEMSFSFSSQEHRLEYNGHALRTLFAQTYNLLRPRFYRLLKDIMSFHRDAKNHLADTQAPPITVRSFVDKHGYSTWFWQVYLMPMVAAIWSSAPNAVEEMPANFILNFFNNHGLLSINDMPQWFTVQGGSHNYVKQLMSTFSGIAHSNATVSKVVRDKSGVILWIGPEQYLFDQVIFACHSDTALRLLEKPTDDEINTLSAIPYQENEVTLHTDASVMPKRKAVWASWNYHATTKSLPTLTYYMNRLQALTAPENFFVSVNHANRINPANILKQFSYSHPILNQRAINAQAEFHRISGNNNTYFSGAYWFNGFHEDGIASAVRVCQQLGVAF